MLRFKIEGETMCRWLLISCVILIFQTSCRQSRDTITSSSTQGVTVETNDDNNVTIDDSLLRRLDMTELELERAKKEAKEIFEEAEQEEELKVYTFTFKHSGQCMQVSDSDDPDQATIAHADCVDGDNEKFYLVPGLEEGYFFIKNITSGMCVTLSALNRDPGTDIFQIDCMNSDIQQFLLMDQGEGYFAIQNKFSGLCLDNDLSVEGVFTNIIQWTCHLEDNQQILIEELAASVDQEEI